MSDEWRRPDDVEPPQPTPHLESGVDVPLTNSDRNGPPTDGDRTATNWRRLIALSMVGGVVLGVGLAIAIAAFDDGDDPTGSRSAHDRHEAQQNTGL